MKKLNFTLIMLVFFNLTSVAQEMKTGFKFGLNVANLHEEGVDTKNKMGFHAGVFIEAFIGAKISIQPELLYSTQGSKEEGVLPFPYSIPVKTTIKMGYINLPIMFKYYPTENFSLTAGPQVGFLTNAKLDVESKYIKDVSIDNSKFYSALNKFDYGINFGLEYTHSGVFIAARYNLGLADIQGSTVTYSNTYSDTKSYNRVFQLSTGYKF